MNEEYFFFLSLPRISKKIAVSTVRHEKGFQCKTGEKFPNITKKKMLLTKSELRRKSGGLDSQRILEPKGSLEII